MDRRTLIGAVTAMCAAPGAFAQEADRPALPPSLGALALMRLHSTQGAVTTLGAHLRPGPAVIQFWATWCSPCLAEGRQLAGIRERIGADRLNIIGINMDNERARESGRTVQFIRRARMTYTQLHGTVALYRAFNNPGEGLQIVLPRAYVFHADGRPLDALGRYEGAEAARELAAAVNAVVI
jgi:thiol-disulfide isomerase/thioredoxin